MKIVSLSKVVQDDFTAHTINIQYKCLVSKQITQVHKAVDEKTWLDFKRSITEFIIEEKTQVFSAGRGSITQIILNQYGYVDNNELFGE